MRIKDIFHADKTKEPDAVILKGITYILAVIRGHSKLFLIISLVVIVIPLSIQLFFTEIGFMNKFNMKSMSALSIVDLSLAVAKTFFLYTKREKIYDIYMILQNEWNNYVITNKFYSDNTAMIDANHQGNLTIKFYITLSSVWLTVAWLYIFISPLIFGKENTDLIKVIYGSDLNIKYQSLEYWLLSILNAIVMLVVAFVFNGTECIFICFSLFLSHLLKSVGDKFKDIGRMKYENLREIYYVLKDHKYISDATNATNATNDTAPGCSQSSISTIERDLNLSLDSIEDSKKGLTTIAQIKDEKVLPEEIAMLQLKFCIERHVDVLDYTKQFIDLFSIIVFVQYVYTTIQMCFLLYHMSYTFHKDGSELVHVMHMVITSSNLFLITLMGQTFKNMSTRIAVKIYEMPWYEYSTKLKKCVLLVMTRSQKPVQITGGGFYVASMEGLSKVLTAAFSYYTFLKTINNM